MAKTTKKPVTPQVPAPPGSTPLGLPKNTHVTDAEQREFHRREHPYLSPDERTQLERTGWTPAPFPPVALQALIAQRLEEIRLRRCYCSYCRALLFSERGRNDV